MAAAESPVHRANVCCGYEVIGIYVESIAAGGSLYTVLGSVWADLKLPSVLGMEEWWTSAAFGDEPVAGSEMVSYVINKIPTLNPGQSPQYGELDKHGDFIFGRSNTQAPKRPLSTL
ncbi:hypothetical protein [Ensifer adhaerens]|uniref:hypothetical protein n=1 Tax=Ensifer adhaerens TaxID=106592 RepID=UPI00131A2EF1|nr:hypothetical protein [Ensifer adhaerens]